jgi:hypothetical protein
MSRIQRVIFLALPRLPNVQACPFPLHRNQQINKVHRHLRYTFLPHPINHPLLKPYRHRHLHSYPETFSSPYSYFPLSKRTHPDSYLIYCLPNFPQSILYRRRELLPHRSHGRHRISRECRSQCARAWRERESSQVHFFAFPCLVPHDGDARSRIYSSTVDLTPIPIARPNLPESPIAAALPGEEHTSLRGRVGHGVDVNHRVGQQGRLGVVDSPFSVLRALLPGQSQTTAYGAGAGAAPGPALFAVPGSASGMAGVGTGTGMGTGTGGETDTALWGVRPSIGLHRRDTWFSIAGLTAALPMGPGKFRSGHEGSSEEDSK